MNSISHLVKLKLIYVLHICIVSNCFNFQNCYDKIAYCNLSHLIMFFHSLENVTKSETPLWAIARTKSRTVWWAQRWCEKQGWKEAHHLKTEMRSGLLLCLTAEWSPNVELHASLNTTWPSASQTSLSPATVLKQLCPGWLSAGTSDTLLPTDLGICILLFRKASLSDFSSLLPSSSGILPETLPVCAPSTALTSPRTLFHQCFIFLFSSCTSTVWYSCLNSIFSFSNPLK